MKRNFGNSQAVCSFSEFCGNRLIPYFGTKLPKFDFRSKIKCHFSKSLGKSMFKYEALLICNFGAKFAKKYKVLRQGISRIDYFL